MKAAKKYLSFEHRINDRKTGTVFTFENGVILEANATDGGGSVTYPAKGDVGTFTFPIRHNGDVFHALRQGLPIPAECAAW